MAPEVKNYVPDTNLVINYIKHITNLAKHPENNVLILGEIMISECDAVKNNGRTGKNDGAHIASAFLDSLISDMVTEWVDADKIGLKLREGLKEEERKVLVVDFSNLENRTRLEEIYSSNRMIYDDVRGKIIFLKNSQAIDTENSTKLGYDINIGKNDITYILATDAIRRLNNDSIAKFITFDRNARATANINYSGIAEFPTGGIRVSEETREDRYKVVARGFHFINPSDFFTKDLDKSILNDRNLAISDLKLTKVNMEILKRLSTQDYIIFLREGETEKDFFERLDDNIDSVPRYRLPNFFDIFRLRQTDEKKFSLNRLSKDILREEKGKSYYGFEPRSTEGLLFLDSMFRPDNIYVLYGDKGSGKTYSALYLALAETIYLRSQMVQPNAKVYINKSLVTFADQDAGFMPGDAISKHMHVLQSFDNVYREVIENMGRQMTRGLAPTLEEALRAKGNRFGGQFENTEYISKTKLKKMKRDGRPLQDNINYTPSYQSVIELKQSSGIRGSTIRKGEILIVDEFQQYDPYAAVEILTRLGEGKIIPCGDPFQIDAKTLDSMYNVMMEVIIRCRQGLEYEGDRGLFLRDLELKNRITILNFSNYMRSQIYQAMMYRFHNRKPSGNR